MSDFSKLKDKKKAQRSFVANKASSVPSTKADNGAQIDEPMLVDSSDTSKISSDIPEQPPLASEQSHSKNSGLNQSLPLELEVRSAGVRGRGVWSRQTRRRGEVLLAEVPTITALSTRFLASYCSACFLEAASVPLKRCPACRFVYYCDSECQSRDWALHKRECVALQKWAESAPTASSEVTDDESSGMIIASDAIRAVGRLLWKRQKKGSDSAWTRDIDAMQSHRASLSNNEQSSQLHTHMAHALVRYLGAESITDLSTYGIESVAGLVELVSRFTTNAFAVTSPTLTPIGVCISPTVALFNHSCEPNAVLVFPRAPHNLKKDQPMVQIIAIKDIAPDEEIVISYIDSTLPRHERQQALKETYHFTCDCVLCSKPRDGAYVDPRESMYCPKSCGGVCWLPTEENNLTRCTRCRAVVKDTDAVLDAVRIGQEGLDKASRVQLSDPEKAIQLTTNLIPILTSAGLLPSSHPLLALSRLHTTLLITNFRSPFDSSTIELSSPQIQEERQLDSQGALGEAQEHLDEAVRSATRTCNGLNQVLPYGHPIRALGLTELGKLLSVDEPAPKHLIEESGSSLSSPSLPTISSNSSPQLARAAPYPPSGPQRLKLAYETLVCARGELMVGFGGGKNEGGQIGMEVRKILVDVERELGVWSEGIKSAMDDLPKMTGKK